MFRNTITQTPLTTPEANDYFGNITGMEYRNDNTFLTTLRAMLANRLAQDESLNAVFMATNYSKTQLNGMSASDAFYHCRVSYWIDNNNQLTVHVFRNSDSENNAAWLDFMGDRFEKQYEGWHKVEKVTAFFRKAFQVYCFINPALKSTVLFVEDIDMRRLHFLQCGISAFLPWYFDVEQGFSDEEMELIQSLREKTSDRYEAIIDKIASKYDFQTLRVKKLLADFETRFEREQCESQRREIREIISQINNLNERISDYLENKRNAEIRLLGLEAKIAQGSGDSEIMDYFLRNKSLVLKDVSGSDMVFVVKSTIDIFDTDMAETQIANDGSHFYSYDRNGEISHDDMRLLMKAIFLEKTLKIQTCAAYRFSMRGNVRALSGYDYGVDGKNRMPNPHIDEYNCMGDYLRIINDLLMDNDYIYALEQCIASCRSLNFGDPTVMGEFIKRIQGRSSKSGRCILLPDGNVVKPTDAVKWLHEQQIVEEVEVA